MRSSALFPSLNRRPAAITVTVRELLQKVQRGEVRIPKFQRPLRWKSEQVVQLLDSVWRGYPIGSLHHLLNVKRAWAAIVDEAPSRMRTALEEHWRRVPLLAEVGGLV